MEDFWYGMEMEWKKIASMEYGKIVFHSIPYHALMVNAFLALVITPVYDIIMLANCDHEPIRGQNFETNIRKKHN